MAEWKLFCKYCPFPPPVDWTQQQVHDHQARAHPKEHEDGHVELVLVPLCPDDGSPFELSESGDSGQCPLCGRFEVLRVPEEFR